jgi:hypothetical protein
MKIIFKIFFLVCFLCVYVVTKKLREDDKRKKKLSWISSMYSIHRDWFKKGTNPFKALNNITNEHEKSKADNINKPKV